MQIGIIAALEAELEVIVSNIEGKSAEEIYGRKIYKGKINQTDVVVMLGGVGKVNAAISSQLFISNFKPDSLIVVGLAGGLNPKYEIGDIVIASGVFQHDYGFLGGDKLITHKPSTLPELGIGTGKESIILKLSQSSSILKYLNSSKPSFSKINIDGKDRSPKLYQGIVATGDQFVASNLRKKEIIDLGGDIVEMEGAAIAETAGVFNVPIIIIRSISDKACEKAKFNFGQFIDSASKNNATVITQLIKYLKNA